MTMINNVKVYLRGKLLFRAVLLAGLFFIVQAPAYGQACLVSVTKNENLGSILWIDTTTFSELSEITAVTDYEQRGLVSLCSNASFTFSDNVLTIAPLCLVKSVTVRGIKKNCEEDEDEDENDDDLPIGDDDIAQAPLFLTQAAPPNVMYLLDDSGSMQFELMPDSLILNSARYVFPRAEEIYGNGEYENRVVTVDDAWNDSTTSRAYNAMARSPQINSIYYNPGKTYRPWVKADGSFYPNASPSCAYHNPERSNGSGIQYCRSLIENNSDINDSNDFDNTRWVCGSNCSTTSNKTFWPSTYFWHNGGDRWTRSNYTKIEIRQGNSYSGHGRENRDDCANAENGVCSYAEEIQNFANWYTYYRSRILTARAGTGFAFATQGSSLRVGFGSINQDSNTVDGVNTPVIVNGVRSFTGEARDRFFDTLYGRTIPNAGTPLRLALDAAGKYFSRKDNRGPWGNTPGTNDDTEQLACRRNYTVLTTDGYWSGDDVSGGPGNNNDGSDGPSHSRPAGNSYTYKAKSPFTDNRDDTLADVAMYYWKNDLREDMPNLVPETKTNPAFWQHMVTYGVGIGVAGTIDPDTAFAAVGSGATITWPNPGSQEVYKIDDLVHAAVNGHGGYFSASEPDVFANELYQVLDTIANESKSSASSVAANSTRLDSGTLVYQASFNSLEWSGRIQAYTLNNDGSLKAVAWDTNNSGIPAAGLRNIITGIGDGKSATANATAFTSTNWSKLNAVQQVALRNGASVDVAKARIAWLRGDQRQEGSLFRQRDQILGDIVNSDPFFVGSVEDYGYKKLPGSEGSSYFNYLSSKSSRTAMIYVGANDGMLHGFNAETGVETLAYVPVGVYKSLASLTDPGYQHHYFVDGSPRALDVYINGNWKTVLVGATGAGGRSVFALDVTTPDSFGAEDVLWEFATAADATHKLGVAMSQPVIARLEADSKWVAMFGNGYVSGDTAKLMIVDLASGELLAAIDTGVSGVGNGLSTVVPVDVDGDRITDYVYAGDLKGNLWKFDLSGSNKNNWKVAFKQGNTPRPLYTAVDANGLPQPITSRPTVGLHPGGGYFIYFGTGKYFELGDAVAGANPQVQGFYAIRDNGVAISGRDALLEQSIIFQGTGTTKNNGTTTNEVRLVSNNGDGQPSEFGWYLSLVPPLGEAKGERVVSQPILRNGRIIFATITPSGDMCGYGGTSWLMELDALNGGRISDPVLDINGDGKVDYLDVISVDGNDYLPSGIGSEEMIKTPGIIGAGKLEYKYTSGSSGSVGVVTESAGAADIAGRQSWRQLQ